MPWRPGATRKERLWFSEMMSVALLCVGKLKEKYWRDACAEYEKRLSAFCRFRIVEIPESRLPENPSAAQVASALEEEGRKLLAAAGGAYLTALCIEGKEESSEQLAAALAGLSVGGVSSLAFCVGSSYGLSPQVKAAASRRLSMSPMTFPHQLARVMLCEQIYRAFQINGNGKYHK